MSKEDVTGFITALSPKRPCRNLAPQFNIFVQNGENSEVELRGFGNGTYRTLEYFAKSKSPMKTQVTKSPGYRYATVNEKSDIRQLKHGDVPYSYKENKTPQKNQALSEPISTSQLLSRKNKEEQYSLTGRIWLGDLPPKVQDKGKMLKEDIVLFDRDGWIEITLWNREWTSLSTGDFIEMTFLKYKEFANKEYASSSFQTIITHKPSDEEIIIPTDFDYTMLSNNFAQIGLENFEVGITSEYFWCNRCLVKIKESNMRETAFTCVTCRKTLRLLESSKFFVVPITAQVEGREVEFIVPRDVIEKLNENVTAENAADHLLMIGQVELTYNIKNNFVMKIVPVGEEEERARLE